MMKKYEITDETKDVCGTTLHRIKALRDIPRWGVKAGDPGGWIQDEKNLSHEGDCWVTGNARVSGNVVVTGNAVVLENAQVLGNAVIKGYAVVLGNAVVTGNAVVMENAQVLGNAVVTGNARVEGNAVVTENARVEGNAVVKGYAVVQGNAVVKGYAVVQGNAGVLGNAVIKGYAVVQGNALVTGNARVLGNVWPCSPLCLQGTRHAVFTPDHDHIQIGCEVMTPAEWKKQYRKIGEENGYTAAEIREYGAAIQYAAAWLKTKPWNRRTKTATKGQK